MSITKACWQIPVGKATIFYHLPTSLPVAVSKKKNPATSYGNKKFNTE